MILSVFVKYWSFHYYHKCKVRYIELEAMKILHNIKSVTLLLHIFLLFL